MQGVEPQLLSSLKTAGIQSVLGMALSIPPKLATGGDYDGSGVEVDTETISDLIFKAKKALWNTVY